MISAPERRSIRWLGILLGILLGLTLTLGCRSDARTGEAGGETMGTTWQAVFTVGEGVPRDGPQQIQSLLDEINQALSTYIDTSLISRINRSSDPEAWQAIDAHFATVFTRARLVYDETGGAFNPAVGPLVEAWGFGPETPEAPPDAEAVRTLLALVRFDAFEFRPSPPAVRKLVAGAELDFSAIAKGYAVDAVAGLVESWGATDYFIEIGGEVRTRGEHPAGRPWRIGIERPSSDALASAEVQSVLTLSDAALATSGNYRNYTLVDGRRAGHILNPATGYPDETSLLSVSVLAEDTMTADAYATAFMVMGLDEALRFVEARPGLEAYFMSSLPGEGLLETRSSGFPEPLEP